MTSTSKETKPTFQKHLSLTQVKRLKSQTEHEKRSQKAFENNSPLSSPSQPQTPNSSKPLKTTEDQSRLNKSAISSSKNPSKANPSTSPQPSSTLIKRKPTRSKTTVTSPSVTPDLPFSSTIQAPERSQDRRKTQISEKNKEKGHISPKPLNFTQNPSKNYKIDEDPFKKDHQKFQDFSDQVKITSEETEKFDREKNRREDLGRAMKKNSGNSSLSYHSFAFHDMQQDLLAELTKSVKELNMRLIQSEEITFERLKENLELKNKLKALEGRIEEKSFKVEEKGVSARCAGGCEVF
jgi:hypothetical protein